MHIVLWLALGAAAGILALVATYRAVPHTPWQWAGAILVGLAGGWIGGAAANLMGLQAVNWLGSLVVAFLGALGIIALIRRMHPAHR